MVYAKSLLHLDLDIAKFSPCIVRTSTIPSQPGDAYHVPIDNGKTMCLHCSSDEGNTRFSLVASLSKFAFRIQNPYLLILLIVV